MDQFILTVSATVVGGLVLVFILWLRQKHIHQLFQRIVNVLRLRCYIREQRKSRERNEREEHLNEYVALKSGKWVHRGCAAGGDEIIERRPGTQFVAIGSCIRCGEHGSMPRRSSK